MQFEFKYTTSKKKISDVRNKNYVPISFDEDTKEKLEELVANNQIWLMSLGSGWVGHRDCNPICAVSAKGGNRLQERYWSTYDQAIYEIARNLLNKSSSLFIQNKRLRDYINDTNSIYGK